MEIIAKGISKRFFRKAGESNYFFAVKECDFSLPEAAVTILTGHSGSGKTTLLSMLAGLLAPDAGLVSADSRSLYGPDDKENSSFRYRRISFRRNGRYFIWHGFRPFS